MSSILKIKEVDAVILGNEVAYMLDMIKYSDINVNLKSMLILHLKRMSEVLNE